MAQLSGIFVKLIDEQGAVEHQLHQMFLLWLWTVWIIMWRGGRHKRTFARFLLHNYRLAVFFHQQVETPLYAKHFAEECGFEHCLPHVNAANGFGQVVAYKFLDIAFLHTRVGIEFRHVFPASHSVACHKSYGIVSEKVHHSFLKRAGAPMHRLVEILPGKISKMYGQGVGLRLEFIDQIHKRRFSISLETRRYGRDVHKIVGLVDYEFRHTDFAVIAHAHEVELHAASEQQRQIRPVATASRVR